MMRKVAVVYSAIAIWTLGWLAATFGLPASITVAIILLLPSLFAYRVLGSCKAARKREYGYLGAVAAVAVTATGFLILSWYGSGMDRLVAFDREYQAFQRVVSSDPAFRDVEVSYTLRKRGRVYLKGRVRSKKSYERLIRTYKSMVRSNASGYFDGVVYPGMTSGTNSWPG